MFERRGILILTVLVLSITEPVAAQSPANSTGQAPAPGLREPAVDEKRAKELDEQIGRPMKAESWDEEGKYARAQPLEEKALKTSRRLLGEDHPDTAEVDRRLADNWHSRVSFRSTTATPKVSIAVSQNVDAYPSADLPDQPASCSCSSFLQTSASAGTDSSRRSASRGAF